MAEAVDKKLMLLEQVRQTCFSRKIRSTPTGYAPTGVKAVTGG